MKVVHTFQYFVPSNLKKKISKLFEKCAHLLRLSRPSAAPHFDEDGQAHGPQKEEARQEQGQVKLATRSIGIRGRLNTGVDSVVFGLPVHGQKEKLGRYERPVGHKKVWGPWLVLR